MMNLSRFRTLVINFPGRISASIKPPMFWPEKFQYSAKKLKLTNWATPEELISLYLDEH